MIKKLVAFYAVARKAFHAAAVGLVGWAALVNASSEPGITGDEWGLLLVMVAVPALVVYLSPNATP